MAKRDRWDSSSDEEDVVPKKKQTSKCPSNKEEQDDGEATRSEAGLNVQEETLRETVTANKYKLHNPLLQGCRTVYDTYEKLSHVSEGTYGVVWKARDLATDEIVALKQIKFDVMEDKVQQAQGFPVTALREINVLLALSHECIVNVKEMVVGDGFDKVFMVMEFMELDLKEAMDRYRRYPNLLRQSELKGVLRQIISGLAHMHEKWYLHRDLKTSNILVHRSGRVALCDFGLARRYQDPLRKLTQLVVTLWYRSPELLFGEETYGPAIDVWSVGCIFGELLAQDAILQGQGELDQIDKIFQLVGVPNDTTWPEFKKLPGAGIFRWKEQPSITLPDRFPINAPPHVRQTFLDGNGYNLLVKMLALDPKQRISASDALAHDYFSNGVAPEQPALFDD